MKARVTSLFTTLCLLLHSSAGKCEISPTGYEQLVNEAEESLTMFICTVNSRYDNSNKTTCIDAEAVVLDAHRVSTSLYPGQNIKIHYEIFRGHALGPRETGSLEAGKKYHAYLNRKDGYYTSAAFSRSFRIIESTMQERQESFSCQSP